MPDPYAKTEMLKTPNPNGQKRDLLTTLWNNEEKTEAKYHAWNEICINGDGKFQLIDYIRGFAPNR